MSTLFKKGLEINEDLDKAIGNIDEPKFCLNEDELQDIVGGVGRTENRACIAVGTRNRGQCS